MAKSANGIDYAYIYNVQGDVIALVDSTGSKVVEYYYDAWGKILSVTGTLATTLGVLNPFRYRGYVFDEEAGLYYLRSRYYNPNRSRFVNADSVIENNLFCYTHNNPVARIDSAGTKDYSFLRNKVVDNLTDYLEAIVQYSIETKDNPKVYTISQFLGNCETCAHKGKMTYEHRQCAAAIAEQMEHGMSSTGMTSMMSYDIIVAIAIQDPTRGRNDGLDQDCLLPGAILMCIDWSRNKNPVHHGGIVAYDHNAYQSSRRSKVFVHQDLFVQPWTHMGWHKGVRLDDWLIPIMVDYIDELRRGNEP